MSKSIIIDPGHGGTDPGAQAFGVKEKDWNLRISLYQYERLKELGADVAITRTDDRTLSSTARTNKIRNKYDYCISNHWNAFNGSARGVETIHSIFGGKDFATDIANELVKVTGIPLRRVFSKRNNSGTDWYFMHRLTGGTRTTIIEYGFLDNRADYNWYKNNDNFYKAAEAVIKVICQHIGIDYKAPDEKPEAAPTPAPKSSAKNKTISQMADEVLAGEHGNGHTNRRNSLGISQSEYEKVRAEVNRRAGSVPNPPEPKKTVSQMAQEVIDGKHGNGHEKRRSSLGISQAEYEEVRAEVNRRSGVFASSSKSIDQLAQEVIDGKHGTGDARKLSLGNRYSEVQKRVNELLGASGGARKSIDQMAREIVRGDHGTGHSNRRKSLGISKSEYEKVRKRVNELA